MYDYDLRLGVEAAWEAFIMTGAQYTHLIDNIRLNLESFYQLNGADQ